MLLFACTLLLFRKQFDVELRSNIYISIAILLSEVNLVELSIMI